MASRRDSRRTGLNPLAYMGVEPVSPPLLFTDNRAPTSNDYANYNVGTIWVDRSTAPSEDIWMLVNKDNNVARWVQFDTGSGNVQTLTGDVGGAVGPDALGNIDITGGNSISTAGTPASNNVEVSVSGTTQYVLQIGDASGALDNLPDGVGVDGEVLTSRGPGMAPMWEPSPFAFTGFQAYMSTSQFNVTGDNTTYTLPFDLTEFNFGNDFDTANHWYVAPTDGYYQFVYTVFFNNINPANAYDNSEVFLVRFRPAGALTRNYPHSNINPQPITDNTTSTYEFDCCNTDIIELQAGDRVYLTAKVGSSTKTVGFTGLFTTQLRTRLAGWLLTEI